MNALSNLSFDVHRGATVTTARLVLDDDIEIIGEAKLHPKDTYREDIGLALAIGRCFAEVSALLLETADILVESTESLPLKLMPRDFLCTFGEDGWAIDNEYEELM